MAALPRIHAEASGNEIELGMVGQFPLEHATSFCYYSHNGLMANAIQQAKFRSRPWVDSALTRLFVQELRLANSPWPYDIDCIVPIPLHWSRLLHRGYNQAMAIAEALHIEWNIPIESHCLRKRFTSHNQVGLNREERLRSVVGSFSVSHPERLKDCHILLVDDVLTTGATIVAAADALLAEVEGLRVSFLTLAKSI